MPQVCLDSDDFFFCKMPPQKPKNWEIFQEDLELFIAFKRLKAQSKNISDSDAIKAFENRLRTIEAKMTNTQIFHFLLCCLDDASGHREGLQHEKGKKKKKKEKSGFEGIMRNLGYW